MLLYVVCRVFDAGLDNSVWLENKNHPKLLLQLVIINEIGGKKERVAMSTWFEIIKTGESVQINSSRQWPVGQTVPMGLGSIELRQGCDGGLEVVRRSSRNRFTYSLPLRKDGLYRLGPYYGHRVVLPEEERNPIKRVLRKLDIPLGILVFRKRGLGLVGFDDDVNDDFIVDERTYDNHHCPNGRVTTRWVTDGQRITPIREVEVERPHGFFMGGDIVTYKISQATFAIEISGGKANGVYRGERPTTIIVWSDCNPEVLFSVLEPYSSKCGGM